MNIYYKSHCCEWESIIARGIWTQAQNTGEHSGGFLQYYTKQIM